MNITPWKWVAIALVLAGCGGADGPKLAEVTGKVTLDGAPLPHVNLQFVPQHVGGSPSFGGTNDEGVYKLLYSEDKSGAMVGTHDVQISVREVSEGDDGSAASAKPSAVIPAKYLQPGALTAEVKAGSNTIDFALESK